jgi:transcriptional regulator with XRE-family HTH domain
VPSSPALARQIRSFGANLRRERVARKITQEKLAELADLNIRTLQKIEAGQTNILLTTATRLQKAVGCEWDDLVSYRHPLGTTTHVESKSPVIVSIIGIRSASRQRSV